MIFLSSFNQKLFIISVVLAWMSDAKYSANVQGTQYCNNIQSEARYINLVQTGESIIKEVLACYHYDYTNKPAFLKDIPEKDEEEFEG